jgi:hypothetical protein
MVLVSVHQDFKGIDVPIQDFMDNGGIVRNIVWGIHLSGGKE